MSMSIGSYILHFPYNSFNRRMSVGIQFGDETGAKQSFKDECDINKILDRYHKTGVIDFVNRNEARYGEASSIDFQTSMQIVADGNSMFEEMPAHLRKRFNNDPYEFLRFIENDQNRDEAIKLGLIQPPEPSEAPVAPVATVSGGTEAP